MVITFTLQIGNVIIWLLTCPLFTILEDPPLGKAEELDNLGFFDMSLFNLRHFQKRFRPRK